MQIVHQYKGTNGQLGANIAIFFDREKGGNSDNPFINSLKFGEAVPYNPGDPLAEPPIPEVLGTPLVNV